MAVRRRRQAAQAEESAAEAPAQEPVHVVIDVELVWQGRTIAVRFEPDYLDSEARGLSYGHSHLDIEVTSPKRAPLPITETGYLSHFSQPGTVEEYGGPAAFVESWLNEEAKKPAWRRIEARWLQLDLFE